MATEPSSIDAIFCSPTTMSGDYDLIHLIWIVIKLQKKNIILFTINNAYENT